LFSERGLVVWAGSFAELNEALKVVRQKTPLERRVIQSENKYACEERAMLESTQILYNR
jgi:hypothetical protein